MYACGLGKQHDRPCDSKRISLFDQIFADREDVARHDGMTLGPPPHRFPVPRDLTSVSRGPDEFVLFSYLKRVLDPKFHEKPDARYRSQMPKVFPVGFGSLLFSRISHFERHSLSVLIPRELRLE